MSELALDIAAAKRLKAPQATLIAMLPPGATLLEPLLGAATQGRAISCVLLGATAGTQAMVPAVCRFDVEPLPCKRDIVMQQGRGGIGSHKHGISGYAPHSPRYKFMQQLETNKQKPHKRQALTAKTIAEAVDQHYGRRKLIGEYPRSEAASAWTGGRTGKKMARKLRLD